MKRVLIFFLSITSIANAQIFSEDFNSSTLPVGWTLENPDTDENWQVGDQSGFATFPTGAAYFDDDDAGPSSINTNAQLITPTIDLSASSSPKLSFNYANRTYTLNSGIKVEAFDGTSWTEIYSSYGEAGVWDIDFSTFMYVITAYAEVSDIDLSPYVNSNFKLRFIYTDAADYSYGAVIDDVKIEEGPCTPENDVVAPVPDVTNLPNIELECEVNSSDIPIPSATDACAGIIQATTSDPLSYTEQGTYLITWGYDDGNGNTITQDQTIKVLSSPIADVTFDDATFTYDGNIQSVIVDNLPADASVSYTVTDANNDTENGNSAVNAGIYTVTAVVNPPIDAVNCEDIILTATLTINKAAAAITAVDLQTHTYDGTLKNVAASLNHSETELVYTPEQGYTNAGTYNVTVSAGETDNYLSDSKEVTLVVENADFEGISLANGEFTYDGTPHSILVTGAPVEASVTYTDNGQVDAGTYTVTAMVQLANYNDLELSGFLTVNKAAAAITAVDLQTHTYDGTLKNVAASLNHSETELVYTPEQGYTNAGTYNITVSAGETDNYLSDSKEVTLIVENADFEGISLANGEFTYDGTPHSILVTGAPVEASVTYTDNGQVDAGTYTVTAMVQLANYNDLELSGFLTVNKAAVAITAVDLQTHTYDGTLKNVAASLNHSETELVYTPEQGYTNAGTYNITVSAGETDNYLAADAVEVELVIVPLPLTITANNHDVFYTGDGYIGGHGVSYESFVPDEDETVLSGELSYTGTSQGAKNAGTYVITPSGLTSNNYDITFVDGVLTISGDVENTLSFTSQRAGGTVNVIYGADSLPATASATSGLPVSYTSSNESVATVSADGLVSIRGAGSTRITAMQPGDGNHQAADDIYFDLRVARKELTITANNDNRTYDGVSYEGGNGVHYEGFVYEEDESVLNGSIVYGGTAQAATDVGNYDIIPSGLSTANYAITYRNGSLLVTKRPVMVVFAPETAITKTYDGTVTATVTTGDLAFGPGEVIAGDGLHISLTTGIGSYANKDAGTGIMVTLPIDALSLSGADKDNYAIANTTPIQSEVGSIIAIAITGIALTDGLFIYNGTARSLSITGTLPEGTTVTYAKNNRTDAGMQDVTATITGPNYETLTLTARLTITPAARSLEFPALPRKVYGDADFAAGATASSGEEISYTSTDPRVARVTSEGNIRIIGAGKTTIAASVPINPNYRDKPQLSHTLTVDKADQTITLAVQTEVNRDAGTIPITVSSSSGLPVSLSIDDTDVATLNANNLDIHRLGTAQITATQAGDGNYEPAELVTKTIRVVDPMSEFPIRVHPAVSPNGDGVNEFLMIEGVRDYPNNRVSIFNRNGTVLWEASGYDNDRVRFHGISTGQLSLPAGTYFYIVELNEGGKWKHQKGYFALRY